MTSASPESARDILATCPDCGQEVPVITLGAGRHATPVYTVHYPAGRAIGERRRRVCTGGGRTVRP